VQLPPFIASALEWLLRRQAIRDAVVERDRVGTHRRAALDQARLLIEVARRVAEPAETLPRGSRPAVLLDLYRSAVTWAFRAETDDSTTTLAELWDGDRAERVRAAAGDDAELGQLRELLVSARESTPLDLAEARVSRVRSFAETLVGMLSDPEREVDRLRVQRWTRLALVAAVVGVIVIGTPYLLQGPDLAAGRPFKLSSVYGNCDARQKCGDLMFHTDFQENPWVTFDLGEVKTVRSVEVTNRSDCCAERSIPLVIELSKDNRSFRQVARRDSDFTSFRATFKPQKARYVRLRAARHTALHLQNITVR
jgi:hypothetical protein